MSLHLVALCLDARDPAAMAAFYGGVLERPTSVGDDGVVTVLPTDPTHVPIDVAPGAGTKLGPNQAHLDLTSTSLPDQEAVVARVLRLGGRYLDIGQGPDATHVVMADPEDNELCIIAPGNQFLADTSRVGALSSDGVRDVGVFWSRALGWPLVWDLDEQTAVQAPTGGSKISWGGPPVAPTWGKNRWHLDLAPPADGDREVEVERLVGLGARRLDIGQGDVDWVVMADPGGNELCVLTPRDP